MYGQTDGRTDPRPRNSILSVFFLFKRVYKNPPNNVDLCMHPVSLYTTEKLGCTQHRLINVMACARSVQGLFCLSADSIVLYGSLSGQQRR